MAIHPAVEARLAKLTPDQRAAATAPPGPVLCIAPAGSGKTTTLVARIAWLVASGRDPAAIAAITFNRRAAVELAERVDAALEPLGLAPGSVRVRTFHALGLEILRSAGRAPPDLADRDAVLARLLPEASQADRARLDLLISRLKIEHRASAAEVAADPEAGRVGRIFVAYERALAVSGAVDFDDLIGGALALFDRDATLLATWRAACAELLVDEVQDVDRGQLDLALRLAEPANRVFLVGDDDQTIYGWRLADVRRVLSLESRLPGLRHVALVTNFRCPAPVVERAVRLVSVNRERFPKRIAARDGAAGRLRLLGDSRDEAVRVRDALAASAGATSAAVLARTNRELMPAVVACLELGRPFRASRIPDPLADPSIDGLLERAATETDSRMPLLVRLGQLRTRVLAEAAGDSRLEPVDADIDGVPASAVERLGDGEGEAAADPVASMANLVAWAAPYPDLDAFVAALAGARRRLAELRRDDAPLTLATAHGTKGLEWDEVLVVGMIADRFPSTRAVATALEPARALEEERRLAYVAWTRARRTLTLLYDPAAPSPFLLEAFSPAELGLDTEGTTMA